MFAGKEGVSYALFNLKMVKDPVHKPPSCFMHSVYISFCAYRDI